MGRVLIIEDHPLVAEATAGLLKLGKAEIEVVIARSADEAVHAIDSRGAWDRILLDLDVPGAFGLSLAREIATRGLAGKCCVISASSTNVLVQEASKMGLLGYIAKAMPVDEFSRALDRVLRGERTFPCDAGNKRPQPALLTRRQLELLGLVSDGLSSKQISRVLGISEGTINNHFNATLRAMKVTNRAHAVARGIELGLIAAARIPPGGVRSTIGASGLRSVFPQRHRGA